MARKWDNVKYVARASRPGVDDGQSECPDTVDGFLSVHRNSQPHRRQSASQPCLEHTGLTLNSHLTLPPNGGSHGRYYGSSFELHGRSPGRIEPDNLSISSPIFPLSPKPSFRRSAVRKLLTGLAEVYDGATEFDGLPGQVRAAVTIRRVVPIYIYFYCIKSSAFSVTRPYRFYRRGDNCPRGACRSRGITVVTVGGCFLSSRSNVEKISRVSGLNKTTLTVTSQCAAQYQILINTVELVKCKFLRSRGYFEESRRSQRKQ